MRRFFLIVALFLIAGETRAQIPSRAVRLEGFVQDSSGAAVADAQVILKTDRGVEWGKIPTTPSGIFHFVSVDPGEYTIEVQKQGFKTSKTSVVVGSKPLTSLNITLTLGEL